MTTPTRPAPTPTAYQQAQLKARATAGSLTQAAAKRVEAAINAYANELTRRLGELALSSSPSAAQQRTAIEESLKIVKASSSKLQGELLAAVKDNRDLAFRDVLGVWQQATESVIKASSVVPNALLGGIQTPNILMAGRFDALGGVGYMKSLTASAKAGADEVSSIIRNGIAANISPQELAKRLRPYVAGAQEFEAAFPKKDERLKMLAELRDSKMSPELRNAAYKVRSNSLRIAYSEIHNARAEAELQAYALDPLVYAVRWNLSPNRGSQASPDICDALAKNDFYGFGKGVYPLDKVPLPPHPRDRCERAPVMRAPAEWGKPKPIDPPRTLATKDADVSGGPGMAKITSEQATRIRGQLSQQFAALKDNSAGKAVAELVTEGDKAAAQLAEEVVHAKNVAQGIETAAGDAVAATLPPTVIGGVQFPAALDGDALESAKALVKSAKSNSTTAIKALKEMGVDTSALEDKTAAKLAKEKAAKAAKKEAEKLAAEQAAKDAAAAKAAEAAAAAKAAEEAKAAQAALEAAAKQAAESAAVEAAKLAAEKVAQEQALAAAEAKAIAAAQANPLLNMSAENLQKLAKEHNIFLVTKKAINADKAAFAEELAGAIKGDQASLDTLAKKFGAKVPTASAKPAVQAAAAAAPAPVVASADNVLYQAGKKLGGSNGAQVWVGKDGVARAVKVYKEGSQAYGEALANDLYKRLGVAAPESLTFEHEGKVYFASTMINGVTEQQQLGNLGLTKLRARKVLDGFAADLLTANWDAPGLTLDNLVEVGDSIVRVDNGSAFLFRAQGDRKPAALLDALTEWEGFAPGAANKNPQYAKLFEAAGMKGPDNLGFALVDQIERIAKVEQEVGGWAKYVDAMAPGMKKADRDAIVKMLNARASALEAKAKEMNASMLKTAAKPVPPPPPVPASHKITTAEVPIVEAASKVPDALYFQGGNTTTTAILANGIDLSKLPAGQVGFEMEAAPSVLKPTSKKYIELRVVAQNPLTLQAGTNLDGVISAISGKPLSAVQAMTATEKRAALVAKGYDAIVYKKSGGAIDKVVALKADAVKVVDKAVPHSLIPKPEPVKPAYTPAHTPASAAPSTYTLDKLPTPAGFLRDTEHATVASDYLTQLHTGTAAKLSPSEQKAVTTYTSSGYMKINNALRSGGKETPTVKALRAAIEKSPAVQSGVITYRGLGSQHPYMQLYKHKGIQALRDLVGEVQHDPGFMSTSTTQRTAVSFAGGTQAILEIRSPAGTKGFWARLFGTHRHETELLLTAGQKYRILEIREEQAGYGMPAIRVVIEMIND